MFSNRKLTNKELLALTSVCFGFSTLSVALFGFSFYLTMSHGKTFSVNILIESGLIEANNVEYLLNAESVSLFEHLSIVFN
jgi:hypothetical protein